MSMHDKKGTRCDAHGMVYDPQLHDGCIVCRRETEAGEEPAPGTRSKGSLVLMVAFGLIGLGGVGLVVFANHQRANLEIHIRDDARVSLGTTEREPAGSTERVMLGRPGVDPYDYPNDLPDKLALMTLLYDKRYKQLSRALEGFQSAAENDVRNEIWPIVAMSTFGTADRRTGRRIDAWAKATPKSFAPHLARAHHRVAVARDFLHDGDPSSKERKSAKKALARANRDLERALALHPQQVTPHVLRLAIASAGGADADAKSRIVEDAILACPACLEVRFAYLDSISPRWGGSHALMQEKVDGWAALGDNPKSRQLRGVVDADRCASTLESDAEGALAHCDEALEHGPRAGWLTSRAAALQELGRHEEAVEALEQALELLPQDARTLSRRGDNLLALERHEAAARDYALAMRLDPANHHVEDTLRSILQELARVASFQIEAGEIDAAISNLDQLLELHPRFAEAFAIRGRALAAKGEDAEAERDLLRAIKIDATSLEAHRVLDDLLFSQGRLDEIIVHWNRYLKRKPRDPVALFERSGTYYRRGETELAMRDVKAACRLGNEDACATERRFPQPQ